MTKNKKQKSQKFFSSAFFIGNRKADIPITILVVGVLVVCALAIISFFVSDLSVRSGFTSIETVEEAKLLGEKISFYNNTGMTQEEIEKIIEVREDVQGKHVYVEKIGVRVRYNLP